MARDMVQVRRGGVKSYAGPDAKIGRSQFNRSHGLKLTFDASYLVPIFVDDVLPGDTFTMKLNGFARIFSPLDAPVMDNIQLETSFWFVPSRLVWSNWAAFQGEHDAAGAQDTDYTVPVLATGITIDHGPGVDVDRLGAYMGLPHGLATATMTGVQSLPFRCYNLIYAEWFRDQNLIGEGYILTGDGPDAAVSFPMRKSAKKHDYFTSALPYLQKGDAVSLFPLGATADVKHAAADSGDLSVYSTVNAAYHKMDSDNPVLDASATAGISGNKLYADLAAATSVTINALREAVAIQRLLERDARGGTRYTESIKAHFGVTSPDYRLQRPEFLGGGKSMINVSAVANTSGVDSTNSPSGSDEVQGELRGVGTGVISGHGWAKSFTEHGYVIGLIRARGDVTYFQGLDRMWSRSTRYDFYIPALAMLGEQSILNQEIYISNSSSTDIAVFGYQERWAEYRMKNSRVVGMFDPNVAGNLGHWHLAEDHTSLPSLNATFIEDATPMDRIKTTAAADDFLLDVWFDYRCARPIPVRSVPSLIGRF